MAEELVIRILGDGTQFTRTITQVEAGIRRAQNAGQQFGHTTVTSVQAASASIRLLEGDITRNVRAVERFITTIPGVGDALRAAFPVVGALAFAGVLARVGQQVVEFVNTSRQLPQQIDNAWRSATLSITQRNDELQKQIDTTNNQVLRLEGHHENVLAVELDNARIMADNLAKSAVEANRQVTELLKSNNVGLFQSFFSGTAPSDSNLAGTMRYWMQQHQNAANAYSLAVHDYGPSSTQAADAYKALTALDSSALGNFAQSNIGGGPLTARLNPNAPRISADQLLNQLRTSQDNQQPNITALENFIRIWQGTANYDQNLPKLTAAEGQLAGLKGSGTTVADDSDKLLAQREAFRDKMVRTWREMTQRDAEETQKQIELAQHWADSLNKSDDEVIRKRQELADALEKHQDQMARIYAQNSRDAQLNSIDLAQSSGQLSAHAAAVQIAQIHSAQYDADYQRLLAEIQAAKLSGNATDQYQLEDQLAELQGRRTIEQANDQSRINSTTLAGSFSDAINQFVTASQDAASSMRSLVTGTLESLNNDILNGKGFRQTGADALRGVAGIGLRWAEGSILSTFGVGSGKPDGTAGNPLYVTLRGGADPLHLLDSAPFGGFLSSFGDEAPHGGGILGSLASAVFAGLPGFASGGRIGTDGPVLVGERGPEILSGVNGGSVMPNNVLGGTTNHVYIDASGSTDPAATEAAVHRAMSQYFPYSVGASVQANRDYKARRPLSAL